MSAPTTTPGHGRLGTRPPSRGGLPPGRVRVWLAAAIAALLVLLYLSVELTYASTHLDPPRYAPVEPGEVGRSGSADFRLLSLRRTEAWGREVGGGAGSPDPGAVWVVAQLEVTPRVREDYLLCTMDLVATDGRSWEPEILGPTHEGESCAPDPGDVEIGATYPFVLAYQVPISDADRLAGLAIQTYSWRSYPLIRPPA